MKWGRGRRFPRVSKRGERLKGILRNPGMTGLGLSQPCIPQPSSHPLSVLGAGTLSSRWDALQRVTGPQVAELEGPLGSLWVRKQGLEKPRGSYHKSKLRGWFMPKGSEGSEGSIWPLPLAIPQWASRQSKAWDWTHEQKYDLYLPTAISPGTRRCLGSWHHGQL